MKRLSGKTAIITGGASGFGAATVRRFVEHGCRVVLADIDTDGGEKLTHELGENCIFVHCNHYEHEQNQQAIDTVLEHWGKLDILFNNAGIGWSGNFEAADDTTVQKLLDVNLIGQLRLTQQALLALRDTATKNPDEGAVLLFTASGLGVYGVPQSTAYTLSKHGVIGLMRALAAELGPQNIRVNAICPGIANTPFISGGAADAWGDQELILEGLRAATPLRRLIEPDDVAYAALYLASQEGRMVHATTFRVDGGAHT